MGPLHGVPVGVKDLIFTHDMPTVGGSTAYLGFVPDADDVAVERIRAAGALIIGKTNVPTFGFGPGTSNPITGTTVHPHDPDRSPGGSSGGSAVAVATGMCPLALGSDGGGSIRIPAALCGVLGMKPTFGLVPLYPSCRDSSYPGFSAWETLEHIGPIARSAEDLALLLGVIVGLDTRDRHSVPSPFGEFAIDGGVPAGLRVGLALDFGGDIEVSPAVADAVRRVGDRLARAGAVVEATSLVLPALSGPFTALSAVEADPRGLRDLLESYPDGVNERIRGMLETSWSFDEIADAVRVRKDAANVVAQAVRRFDVIVSPCLPSMDVPADLGGSSTPPDPQRLSGFTMAFNFTGHPALSLPVDVPGQRLPAAVQLVADRFRDDLLLSVAAAVGAFAESAVEQRPEDGPR
jgi:aspartyl-tRNA(Asn)/glutamyl-tRNA(Gln) amidotransferase subunit A